MSKPKLHVTVYAFLLSVYLLCSQTGFPGSIWWYVCQMAVGFGFVDDNIELYGVLIDGLTMIGTVVSFVTGVLIIVFGALIVIDLVRAGSLKRHLSGED